MIVTINELARHEGLPGAVCTVELPDRCTLRFCDGKDDARGWGLRAECDTGRQIVMMPNGRRCDSPASLVAWPYDNLQSILVDDRPFCENPRLVEDGCVEACLFACDGAEARDRSQR